MTVLNPQPTLTPAEPGVSVTRKGERWLVWVVNPVKGDGEETAHVAKYFDDFNQAMDFGKDNFNAEDYL